MRYRSLASSMNSAGAAWARDVTSNAAATMTFLMLADNAGQARTSPSSHIRDRALVHLVEHCRVLLLDDLALDLERRGQLAFIHRQVFRQHCELLDRLVLCERLVHLVEVRREHLL